MLKKKSNLGGLAENSKPQNFNSSGYMPDKLASDLQTINPSKKSNVSVIQYGKNVPKKQKTSARLSTANLINQKPINPTDQAYQAWINQICKFKLLMTLLQARQS